MRITRITYLGMPERYHSLMMRKKGRLAFFVWATLAQGFLNHAGARFASVPMKSYMDRSGGISLRYPAVWTFSPTAASYFPAAISPKGEPVQAAFNFSPQGNYYEHTTLTGLHFLYRREEAPSQSACEAILVTNRDIGKVEPVTLHGVPFAHLAAGEAGMTKSESQDAYATWRGGICYLFEEQLDQIAQGTDDQKSRMLTALEVRALRRHLNDILQSVKLSSPRLNTQ